MDENAKSASWHEVIPPGEAAQFDDCIRTLTRYQEGFARRGDGRVYRGFHVKSHAGLNANFRVLEEIPPAAKHGVFKEARTFAAWVRFSNGFSAAQADWFPDLLGFAVKLSGIEGPKLMPGQEHSSTQDFLALNHAEVPADDAVQMMLMAMSAANVCTAPFKLIHDLGLAPALRIMLWTLRWLPRRLLLRSIAAEDFYGLTPMTIGPHAVKFKWTARSPVATKAMPRRSCRNYLRDELRQRLAEGDIRYDFLAQFYVDPRKTSIDGAYAWKTEDTLFVKLAELTIPACDLDSVEARRTEARLAGLSFNPWHAVAEHRPIGNVQRGRRVIYEGSARLRGRDPDH